VRGQLRANSGHSSDGLANGSNRARADTRDEAEIKQTVRKLVEGGFLVGGVRPELRRRQANQREVEAVVGN
jgi:hypothetical protein